MVKKFLVVMAMLLTLGLSAQGVAAQLDDSADTLSPEDISGLNGGYSRTYAPDMEALMASPSSDGLDLSSVMRNITIQAYTFDSDDEAKDFYDLMMEQMESELAGELTDMGETEISDASEIDKDGVKITIDEGDLGVGMTMLIFVDGDTVFSVMVMDADVESATALSVDIANYIIDAEVEDENITFNEDGTSTGGVFDRMPASGDDAVGGLKADMDIDIIAEAAS